jgi:hypothetical protein
VPGSLIVNFTCLRVLAPWCPYWSRNLKHRLRCSRCVVSNLSVSRDTDASGPQSITNPLLASLQQSIQSPVNGPQDILPVLQAHHVIRALGSVAKGFPEAPQTTPVPLPAWILVLKQVAEAILVSLEAMNQHRAIRDAVSHICLLGLHTINKLFKVQVCVCTNHRVHWIEYHTIYTHAHEPSNQTISARRTCGLSVVLIIYCP